VVMSLTLKTPICMMCPFLELRAWFKCKPI
jgi:hypothetical protein